MKNCLWPRAILPGTSNPVCIRTAVESDIDKLTAHFERLSQPARYNRFMGAVSDFSRIVRDCTMPKRKVDFFTLVVEWREAGCSMCLAMNADRLEPGERCASTSNRNFEGR